jgi:ABC-2 type transport system permease protein
MNNMLLLMRREVWEHRSLWITPLIVASVVIIAAGLGGIHLGDSNLDWLGAVIGHGVHAADPEYVKRARLYGFALTVYTVILLFTTSIAVFFYLLDTLLTERKDRSILFWKSLPISDREVVTSKVLTGLVLAPLFALVVSAIGQLVFALVIWARFGGSGPGALLIPFDLGSWARVQALFLVLVPALMLWYLPIASYLLLVSVSVKRNAFLWALLPPAALLLIEAMLMPSHYFASFLGRRFVGAFAVMGQSMPANDDPNLGDVLAAIGHVFTSLETWLGVVVAALAFIFIVRMRRYRDDT